MHHFDEIFGIAAGRHGGEAALNQKLDKPLSPARQKEDAHFESGGCGVTPWLP